MHWKKKMENNLIKIVVLSSLLIECFDELEKYKLFNTLLKKTVKRCSSLLEKQIDDAWKNLSEKDKKMNHERLLLVSKSFEDSIKQIL